MSTEKMIVLNRQHVTSVFQGMLDSFFQHEQKHWTKYQESHDNFWHDLALQDLGEANLTLLFAGIIGIRDDLVVAAIHQEITQVRDGAVAEYEASHKEAQS